MALIALDIFHAIVEESSPTQRTQAHASFMTRYGLKMFFDVIMTCASTQRNLVLGNQVIENNLTVFEKCVYPICVGTVFDKPTVYFTIGNQTITESSGIQYSRRVSFIAAMMAIQPFTLIHNFAIFSQEMLHRKTISYVSFHFLEARNVNILTSRLVKSSFHGFEIKRWTPRSK
jgi:hypothetical protein